ncbi:MAG: hypothetical protein AAFR02_01080 [Pseudomonadota bacterium]
MKPSAHIRPRQAREVRRAARHSYRIGKPLNLHVTIDYGWRENGDELQPSRLHRDIRRRIWSWWDYKRKKGQVTGKFCDLTIWEAPNGKHHAHWLIHIPEELMEEARLAIQDRSRKVLPQVSHDTVFQQEIENLNGLIDYLLKGTEPEYAKSVGIDPEYQGAIWCRRAVPSMSLGRAARGRDWRTGGVVNTALKQGLPKPREVREMLREGVWH